MSASPPTVDDCVIFEGHVIGHVCEGGCCRAIIQKIHGRVYGSGESFISWHQPSDPLRNGYLSSGDPSAGRGFLHLWEQWAENTE